MKAQMKKVESLRKFLKDWGVSQSNVREENIDGNKWTASEISYDSETALESFPKVNYYITTWNGYFDSRGNPVLDETTSDNDSWNVYSETFHNETADEIYGLIEDDFERLVVDVESFDEDFIDVSKIADPYLKSKIIELRSNFIDGDYT